MGPEVAPANKKPRIYALLSVRGNITVIELDINPPSYVSVSFYRICMIGSHCHEIRDLARSRVGLQDLGPTISYPWSI